MYVYLHFGQMVKSGKFRKYDYGKEGNLKRYGQETPPDYNVGNITCPVVLCYGDGDWVSATTDVERLADELPNATKYEVPVPSWAHFDFLIAKQADRYINDKVVELLEKYRYDTY